MRQKHIFLNVITLLALGIFVTACGGGAVVEKIVTVEDEKVVTGEGEKEVEKIVTVGVEAEVEEATEAPTEEAAPEKAGATETAAETAAPTAQGRNTLQVVKDRGHLICGGNADSPGFGMLDPATNSYEGFDIDLCKAVAAAVFGDATKMEVRSTNSTDR